MSLASVYFVRHLQLAAFFLESDASQHLEENIFFRFTCNKGRVIFAAPIPLCIIQSRFNVSTLHRELEKDFPSSRRNQPDQALE